MEKIIIEVEDFTVVYKQGDGNNVKVYVDGDLVEDRQSTWFMAKLLEETLRLKNQKNKTK